MDLIAVVALRFRALGRCRRLKPRGLGRFGSRNLWLCHFDVQPLKSYLRPRADALTAVSPARFVKLRSAGWSDGVLRQN